MDKSLVIDNIKVTYTDEGEGEALLLLHGWGASRAVFRPIVDVMSKRYRVIAPDFPGFGDSDEPSEPWDVSRYAEFTNKFIEAAKADGASWLAHSFGGRVAIKLYSEVKVKPQKIILVDSAGIKPKRTVKYYVKIYSYKLGKRVLSLPLIRDTGLYELLIKNAGSSDYKGLSPVMKATMSLVVNEDLREYLKDIASPTLLVWGDKDTATPIDDAKIMDSLLPDSGIVVLEGAGHFSYLDRPQRFFAALKYFMEH